MLNPRARQDDIVVQELFDEVVIYDLNRDQVHALNSTAAFVWQHCDGQRTTDELAELLQLEFQTPQAGVLLELALHRLEHAQLLTETRPPTDERRLMTRREALKLVGVTVALLPVVKSIVAPTMAQAASLKPVGAMCGTDGECCSENCESFTCHP